MLTLSYQKIATSVYASGTNSPQGTGQLYFSTSKETATDSLGVTSLWISTLINDTIPSNALSRWYYVWFKNSLRFNKSLHSESVVVWGH